jgi:hypothetical protein
MIKPSPNPDAAGLTERGDYTRWIVAVSKSSMLQMFS